MPPPVPPLGSQWRINTGHPLAASLLGAWVFDRPAFAHDLLTGGSLVVGGTGAVPRATAAGPAYRGAAFLNTALPARLQPSSRVSLFWYGILWSNIGGSGANPAIVSLYHNTSNAAPYVAYGLHRPNDTDLWVAYNNAGTFGNLTATSVIASAEYESPLALGATFGVGSVLGYKNGREIVSGSGISGITYGGTAQLVFGHNIFSGASAHAGAAVALTYIFGTELSPTDHAQLAANPYALLTTGRSRSQVSVSAPSGLQRVQVTPTTRVSSNATCAITTFGTAPTVGNGIVVLVKIWRPSTGTVTACSDNRGNTYAEAVTHFNGSPLVSVWYCAPVATTGSPLTITPTGPTGSYWGACAIEVSGVGTGLVLDTTATNAGSTTSPSTGTTAGLSYADEFLAAAYAASQTVTSITVVSATPVWTEEFEDIANTYIGGEGNSRIVSGAAGTTQSCSWTWVGSASQWASAIATFRAGTGTTD